jgi:hypothetical protein
MGLLMPGLLLVSIGVERPRRAMLWQRKRPFRSFCRSRQDAIVLFLHFVHSG